MSPFDYAIEKCKETPHKRGYSRHFCVILDKRGRVVSEASNSYTKTSPVMKKAAEKLGLISKIYCHAEQLAIVRAKGRGHKLIVVRVNKDGYAVNSEPCPICKFLISETQIKEIEWS